MSYIAFKVWISWESNPWSCGLALLWVTGTTGEMFLCSVCVKFITRYQIRGNHPLLLCHLSFPSLSTQIYSWVHFLVVMHLSFRTCHVILLLFVVSFFKCLKIISQPYDFCRWCFNSVTLLVCSVQWNFRLLKFNFLLSTATTTVHWTSALHLALERCVWRWCVKFKYTLKRVSNSVPVFCTSCVKK